MTTQLEVRPRRVNVRAHGTQEQEFPMREQSISAITTVLMTAAEARASTDRLKHAIEDTALLVADLHDREAWRALGFKSWAAYVDAEFPFKRRESYELIDQGRAMRLLSQELGRPVEVTIRQARLLKAAPRSVQHVAQLVAGGTEPAAAIQHVTQHELPVTRSRFDDGYGSLPGDDGEAATAFRCPKCGWTAPVVDEWQGA
jgi:hypothetical protein